MGLRGWRLALRHLGSTGFGSIARRYFAANLFDGVLTALGLVLGYYFAGGASAGTLIATALAAGLGLGISGFVSSLLVEMAERHRELAELERVMMRGLHGTVLGYARKLAVFLSALANSVGAVVGTLTVVAPMLAADAVGFGASAASAVAVGFAELLALGVYLARTSGASALKYAAAMLGAGLALVAATLLMGG